MAGKAIQVLCFWLSRTAPIAAISVMALFIYASVPAKAQTTSSQTTPPIPEWQCPVSGYVYESLSPWLLYGYPRSSGGWHRGLDIPGDRNADLVAMENGMVNGFWDSTGGWSAFLRADSGNMYYYTHLNIDPRDDPKNDWPDEEEGGWIPAGARVGSMGDSGNAAGTGVHLHFEFRLGAQRNYIDPLPYVSRYCVA